MPQRRPLDELKAHAEAAFKERHAPTKPKTPAARDYQQEKDATLDRMKELREARLGKLSP